jgi:hypothetical protein
MNDLISGAIVMGYLVAGGFFFRFWKRSKDGFFIFFAIAFWVLGAQRLAIAYLPDESEDNVLAYSVRLAAFVLILAAIWYKNRSAKA